MATLVLGASGNTGQRVVEQLLQKEKAVKIVVREGGFVSSQSECSKDVEIIRANILELEQERLEALLSECDSVIICLGHNLSFKGMFLPPRKLVTQSVENVCRAINGLQPASPIKLVLMNSSGTQNQDLDEVSSFSERCVKGALRLLLPPFPDNERSAEFLRSSVGKQHPYIQWVTVRPDSLIDESDVSPYQGHPSPIRSPIFDAGQVSRVNVAHFMSDLICCPDMWSDWQGKMPVLYNQTSHTSR